MEWKAFELGPGAPSAAAGDPVAPTEYVLPEVLDRAWGGCDAQTANVTPCASGSSPE